MCLKCLECLSLLHFTLNSGQKRVSIALKPPGTKPPTHRVLGLKVVVETYNRAPETYKQMLKSVSLSNLDVQKHPGILENLKGQCACLETNWEDSYLSPQADTCLQGLGKHWMNFLTANLYRLAEGSVSWSVTYFFSLWNSTESLKILAEHKLRDRDLGNHL